jgi:hypothetical protein
MKAKSWPYARNIWRTTKPSAFAENPLTTSKWCNANLAVFYFITKILIDDWFHYACIKKK